MRARLDSAVLGQPMADSGLFDMGALNSLLAVITALAIVAAMRIVGILLIAAMMVLPVASAQLLARSFRSTLTWAVGVGVVSTILGLAVARIWDLAPSGAIVLVTSFQRQQFRPRLPVGERRPLRDFEDAARIADQRLLVEHSQPDSRLQRDAPGVRPLLARRQPEERRLAGTVGADQRHLPPRANEEGRAVQHLLRAVRLADAGEGEGAHGRRDA